MNPRRPFVATHVGTRAAAALGLAALLVSLTPSGSLAATKATKTTKKVVPSPTTAPPTTQAPTTAGPTPPPTTTIPRGGTMVAAISSDPGQLNPAITTSGATHSASELMYNGLVELDAKGRPIPELAESWSVKSGDYTFTALPYGITATWGSSEPSILPQRDVYATFGTTKCIS